MGQIVSAAAKPKRCNLNKLSQLGTPAAGEHILVSSDNSMNEAGQGDFDCYIVGNGHTAATALELKSVETHYQELIEAVGIVYDGKYVNTSGNLVDNPDWFVVEYDLPSSVVAGDIFVWNGITSDTSKCTAFYLNGTFKQALSATGDSRTITITAGASAIGSNVIRASFMKSKYVVASLSLNGSELDFLGKTRIDKLEEGLDETNENVSEIQSAVDDLGEELFEKVGNFYSDKYVDAQGNLVSDSGWFVVEYYLSSPVRAGDVFVWKGIEQNTPKMIGFYRNNTMLTVRSATGTSRTFAIAEGEATIGATLIKASYLKSKKNEASLSRNNVVLDSLSNSKTRIEALDLKIGAMQDAGTKTQISVPAMELGTIDTNGRDASDSKTLRVPNNARISVNKAKILARGYLTPEVKAIIPNAATIWMNIHCYNSDGGSLGRTLSGWVDIDNGHVFELLENTALVRFTCLFHDANGNNITLANYVSALTPIMADILSVSVYDESLCLLRDDLLSVENEIIYADKQPKEGSNKIITSGAVYSAINNSATQYSYYGLPIQLKKRQKFDVEDYMAISRPTSADNGQGCINYGNKLLVGGNGGYVRVFDLDTKANLGDITLDSASPDNHVNNLSWGIEGDNNNVDFPKYLYISECFGQGRCFVENFNLTGSTLVQTINYVGGTTVFPGAFQWVVDTDGGYIYVVGLTTESYTAQNAKIGIKKFTLPAISEGTAVELTDSDVIESYEYDGTFDYMYVFQGALYYEGKVFLCTGGYDNGITNDMPHRIFVIDLLNGEVISLIDVRQVIHAELEACFIYKGKLFACYPNNGKLYALTF